MRHEKQPHQKDLSSAQVRTSQTRHRDFFGDDLSATTKPTDATNAGRLGAEDLQI